MKDRHYYFIRPNGTSWHNDRRLRPEYFVEGEPLGKRFNYSQKSLDEGIVRIGWPNTGDLRRTTRRWPCRTQGYPPGPAQYVLDYLESFRTMPRGSIVLMPDNRERGRIYIGKVVGGYCFHYNIENGDWYECAHRCKVSWVRESGGSPRRFSAANLRIPYPGGFWRRAFARIDLTSKGRKIADRIDALLGAP